MKKYFSFLAATTIAFSLFLAPAPAKAEGDMLDLSCPALIKMFNNKSDTTDLDITRTIAWVLGYYGAKTGKTQVGDEPFKYIGMALLGYCAQNADGNLRGFVKHFDEDK